MAKKPDDEEEKPEPWSPDKPLPDEEDETQTQRRFMAERRMKFLHEQADKASKVKPGKEKEKSKLW